MTLQALAAGFSAIVIVYFVLWNTSQIAMAAISGVFIRRWQRRRTPRNLALATRLASPPLVSIVVPARNEGLTIVPAIHALLAMDYEAREIVVVNDGSTDNTVPAMTAAFKMVPAPLAFEQPLATAAVRQIHRSVEFPGLVMIDKDSGGCKADAANAGINAASGSLVLIIDADTVLEPDALTRAVTPMLEDPAVVAVGGHVAIANGCRIESARLAEVAMPRAWLARFQVVEYLRSFLLFRFASARPNGVTIISGAFGLFRRDAVIAVGGYDPTAIGEDMDLTLRLQAHFRRLSHPARIAFTPAPVCWTQAPEDFHSLQSQRCRWRRGLLQSLWRHRRLLGNPRYGIVGLGTFPYVAFFEGLGPILEFTGYTVATIAAVLGILNWQHYRLLLAVAVLFGIATSLVAVYLSDVVGRRYASNRDLVVLVVTAVLENVGYRQLNSWWGMLGTAQAMTGKGGWGSMTRRSF